MNSNRFFLHAAAMMAIAVGCSFAHATPINGTPDGLLLPGTTITFDEHVLAPNTNVIAQYADYGVSLDPGLYYTPDDPDLGNYFPVIAGHYLGNYMTGEGDPTLGAITLMFSTPQTRASFGLAANDGAFTFDAYLGNTLAETFTAPDVSFGYYGFSNVLFDRIVITSLPLINYFDFDNLQFDATPLVKTNAPNLAAVPEPGVVALLGLGLLGAAATRRRSRKAA